ncbi:hypothetical protein AB6A40_006036 [Gnathostoma spinigerum]|uniref:Uncharacterized protein n=1 Tax=Gnathostoma spinigerum TaxID=75299 RepID=A0ABD6ERZ8_9BILA
MLIRPVFRRLPILEKLYACVSYRLISATEPSSSVGIVPDDHFISTGDGGVISGGYKLKSIGRALEAYIAEAREHSKMIAKERAEYERGKRHLANIMGLDANSITQSDIDRCIEYLFPSGLTDLKARPVMKPPEEILPKFRKYSFDEEGRPTDSLFFTLKYKFHRLLSDIGWKTLGLVRYQYGHVPKETLSTLPPHSELTLTGSVWLSKDALSRKLGETISDEMYAQLIIAFEYMCSLPFAGLERDFIFEYRMSIASDKKQRLFGPEVPAVEVDEKSNRRSVHSETSMKRSRAYVHVTDAGTGKYVVNGQTLDDFRSLQAREIFLSPMIITDLLGKVDVIARVEGAGGPSVVPRVVRHGVALGIAALYPDHFEKLRLGYSDAVGKVEVGFMQISELLYMVVRTNVISVSVLQ